MYISGDILSFIKIIGIENYSKFSQKMFIKCFKLRRRLIKGESSSITEDDVKEIESLVASMQNVFWESQMSEDKRKI